MTIRTAERDDMDAVRRLFVEYAESLDFDLCFQDFENELDALPGPYAEPDGTILVAEEDDETIGVVAIKPLGTDDDRLVCEMKRLYVEPEYRGRGIGRELASAIVDEAQKRDYEVMRLDTVATMHAARSVYRSLGFEKTTPYYHNPLDDVVYYEKDLRN
jgi:ribosomal protein S18 acetylase RimI-like enzyme